LDNHHNHHLAFYNNLHLVYLGNHHNHHLASYNSHLPAYLDILRMVSLDLQFVVVDLEIDLDY